MPLLDGYESTRRIRASAEAAQPKIIALTASAFEEQQSSILAAGCDDLVRKPFQEAVIFEKMAQQLGVQYLYEELSPQPANTSASLTPEMLTIMPPEWVAQLHQAALCTDEQQIFDLLEKIPAAYASVQHTLTEWVNNFRCDKILDLTKRQ